MVGDNRVFWVGPSTKITGGGICGDPESRQAESCTVEELDEAAEAGNLKVTVATTCQPLRHHEFNLSDCPMVCSPSAAYTTAEGGDRGMGAGLGHQGGGLPFTWGRRRRTGVALAAGQKGCDHVGVDDRAACVDVSDVGDELADGHDPAAQRLGSVRQQLCRTELLDVLPEHHDGQAGGAVCEVLVHAEAHGNGIHQAGRYRCGSGVDQSRGPQHATRRGRQGAAR